MSIPGRIRGRPDSPAVGGLNRPPDGHTRVQGRFEAGYRAWGRRRGVRGRDNGERSGWGRRSMAGGNMNPKPVAETSARATTAHGGGFQRRGQARAAHRARVFACISSPASASRRRRPGLSAMQERAVRVAPDQDAGAVSVSAALQAVILERPV